MEVHHHAHESHGKKNWKSYFWEFLMLFLAVFCGFMAEYQLEHVVEKHRAEEFAFSFRHDIKVDSASVSKNILFLDTCIVKIDELITILKKEKLNDADVSDINRLSVYAFIFPSSVPNESTLQQMLNSGALRYFRNKDLVDSITSYNTTVALYKTFRMSALDFNSEFRIEQLKIVEVNPIIEHNVRSVTSYEYLTNGKPFPFDNPPLVTTDPSQLRAFANWCALKKFYMINVVNLQNKSANKINYLLEILNKVYPENENKKGRVD